MVMANYELDDNGQRKVDDDKEVVAIRPFIVRGMDKEVQDELRKELDSGPITLLMILWNGSSGKVCNGGLPKPTG